MIVSRKHPLVSSKYMVNESGIVEIDLFESGFDVAIGLSTRNKVQNGALNVFERDFSPLFED